MVVASLPFIMHLSRLPRHLRTTVLPSATQRTSLLLLSLPPLSPPLLSPTTAMMVKTATKSPSLLLLRPQSTLPRPPLHPRPLPLTPPLPLPPVACLLLFFAGSPPPLSPGGATSSRTRPTPSSRTTCRRRGGLGAGRNAARRRCLRATRAGSAAGWASVGG